MKRKLTLFLSTMVGAILSGIGGHVAADAPEEHGYQIFSEAEHRADGYVDSAGTIKMILNDAVGGKSEREMKVKSLEGAQAGGDKMLIVFESPKDQKGSSLLTYQHEERDDDQWLYLPALKRVKKIASNNKTGPFMGSEFSFEDMAGQQLNENTYKWLRDETYEGQDCYVVESYPKDENSGYTKIVSWLDKKHYRILKADFYDRKSAHQKTLKAKDYSLYLEKYWRPTTVEMVNLQTGKSTLLITSKLEFKTGLDQGDFSQNSLQRAR